VSLPLPPDVVSKRLVVTAGPVKLRVAESGSGGRVFMDAALVAPVTVGSEAEAGLWTLDTTSLATYTDSRVWMGEEASDAALPWLKSLAGAGGGVAGAEVKLLTITMEKRTPTWWRSVCVGHPEVDASIIDSTVPVDSYDADTQAAIRKIVAQQREGGTSVGSAGGGGGLPFPDLGR